MALELRSQLCTFENSTNCNEISFEYPGYRSTHIRFQNSKEVYCLLSEFDLIIT